MSVILIEIADILGSRAKTSYFHLTQCIKLKHKDLESCLSRTCLFYSVTLQCWTWKCSKWKNSL